MRGASAKARAAAEQIAQALAERGHIAYFAGGCVRDELLGLSPTDYDVATDATPERVRSIFKRTAEVGASFGVMLVRDEGVTIEVATFRAEGQYSDRRRPDEVRFSDPETDACRRDFTINALFLDPLAARDAPSIHGHVVDYVGGLADLDARLVRAVGDAEDRLAEDNLRALRAVRFAARLDFHIDPATQAAIQAHAGELAGVSRERVGDELRRMLTHPGRARAADLLHLLGLDVPVLGPAGGGDEAHQMLAGLDASAPFALALAALMLDRHPGADQHGHESAAAAWRRSLCLSNGEVAELRSALAQYHHLASNWLGERMATQKRSAAARGFEAGLTLLSIREPALAERVRARVQTLRASEGGIAPAPILTGHDLIAHGYEPGPDFGAVLDAVYDAQLEGRVRDQAEALELVQRVRLEGGGPRPGARPGQS